MREHQHEVELLVMDPSFVRSQFIPPEFEPQLEGVGARLSSSGYLGRRMMGAELDHYIGQILELELSVLHTILIDVTLSQAPQLKKKNWYKRRTIEWHTPRQLWSVAIDLAGMDLESPDRWSRLWTHARHAPRLAEFGRSIPGPLYSLGLGAAAALALFFTSVRNEPFIYFQF